MKLYIKKIIVFLLPLILFFGAMEISLRNIPNDYAYKNEYLENFSDEIEILFLGNSHVFYGIDPSYLDYRGFNSSHISQSMKYDYLIYDKFSTQLSELKYLVIPMSYASLFLTLDDGIESWRTVNYTLYYDIQGSNTLSDHLEVTTSSGRNNAKKIFDYYVLGKDNISCSEFGFGLNYHSSIKRDLDKTGKDAAKRHTNASVENYYKNSNYLEKIISLAETKNVQVILFTPPVYKTYIDNMDKNQLLSMYYKIDELLEEYDHVKYVNYLDSGLFDNDDYYDADHLNEIGAKKLTELLVEQLNDGRM